MDPVFTTYEPGATMAGGADRSQKAGNAAMGKDEFLQLLVTQLSNQDPLNPMDGQEFAAQLAQFTSVEQLINISDVLAENGEMNGILAQSINSGVAAGLIGKTVRTSGNTLHLKGEEPTELSFRVDGGAETVKLTIRNAAGDAVREIELGARQSGDHEYVWDGLNDSGHRVMDGEYTFELEAANAAGESVSAETFFKGKVDRVSFGRDGVMLWIGDVRVPMSEVESVQ